MEHRETIRTLFNNYLRGEYTAEELDIILAYFHVDAEGPYLTQLIEHELDTELDDSAHAEAIDQVAAGARAYLTERIRQPTTRPRLSRWIPYAAAAILAVAIGGWLFISDQQSAVSLAATEILPGGNRATLTLADGRTIDLDEAQTGIVIGTENITYTDGSAVNPADSPHAGLTTYDLQLTTPKSGTYQITLPDGSRVWLNAASTLKYPSRFANDTREVILEGEAFFEIQEIQGARVSRAPFNVLTAGQVVQVLGTQFNISAYPDEAETKTTLVEGKVKVTSGTRNGNTQTGLTTNDLRLTTKILSPGEQSTTRGSAITVNTVDTESYTSWKDGIYVLDNGDLHQLIRQLERWYDVEFVMDGNIQKPVSGIIPRNANLSEVLRAIGDNTGLTFTFGDSPAGGKGRRIMVAE